MPVTKVPVVHKFGIISYSQRLQLQERLLKQSFPEVQGSKQSAVHTSRLPLEITETFIQQYNNAKGLDECEKFEDLAQKMLERIKRRTGVRVGSQGQHINLPLAWTELSQLAQCKGSIQEDCLDVLIISLDQAPLEHCHIPALFFLAETMLYWLRTDVIHQPYLRTAEIKLLRMGQLVFTRLFYHHMAGELREEKEFKERLFTYLDGLKDYQDAYRPYPNALLSLRFVIAVGKIILSDLDLVTAQAKEEKSSSDQPDQEKGSKPQTVHKERQKLPVSASSTRKVTTPKSLASSSRATRFSFHSRPDSTTWDSKLFSTVSSKACDAHSACWGNSGALSSSIHDLSPTLWHSLDVWRCTNHLGRGLSHALRALACCASGLANETWIDTTCSMLILAEAAKSNLAALKVMQNLAKGEIPQDFQDSPPSSRHTEESDTFSMENGDCGEEDSPVSDTSSRPSLSDIFERSEEGETESRVKPSEIDSSPDSFQEQQHVTAESPMQDRPGKVQDCTGDGGQEQRCQEDGSPDIEHSRQEDGAQVTRGFAEAKSNDSDLDGKGSKPDGKGSSHKEEDSKLDGKGFNQPEEGSKLDGEGSSQDEEGSVLDGNGSSQEGKDSRGNERPKPVLRDPGVSKHNTGREVSFDENIQLAVVEELNTSDPAVSAGLSASKEEAQSCVDLAHQSQEDSSVLDALDTNKRTGHRQDSADLSGRGSRASSAPTFTNQASVVSPGLHGWHWETGIMYTEVMADICLHGSSSHIQKRALVGDNEDFREVLRRRITQMPLSSAGLLDLAFFHSATDSKDGSENDWSWRIRYGAIHSLVKICRCLTNDKAKEGLRNVAWATLIHAHSKEKDDRVLEALKVGEVHSTLESLAGSHMATPANVIGGRIAARLASIYLPPLPCPVSIPTSKKSRTRRSRYPTSVKTDTHSRQPLRTSLRDEVTLATALHQPQPSFNVRMSFDLRRIVEDQVQYGQTLVYCRGSGTVWSDFSVLWKIVYSVVRLWCIVEDQVQYGQTLAYCGGSGTVWSEFDVLWRIRYSMASLWCIVEDQVQYGQTLVYCGGSGTV
ncbi:uncharacterized protein LOC135465646 isoform X2 [Liolophura sinensis]